MTLILIQLPEGPTPSEIHQYVRRLKGLSPCRTRDVVVDVEPEVYVTLPELADDPAVFLHEGDVDAFCDQRGIGWVKLMICDQALAAKMIMDQLDDCPECGKKVGIDGREPTLCEHCGADLCEPEA